MNRGYIYTTLSVDPYINLSTEQYLFNRCEKEQLPILYFWQNEKTVVVGYNQNTRVECDLDYAAANGIRVVRRRTGGGAVYHDVGNLNFSLLLPAAVYDTDFSMDVIVRALKRCGIDAAKSGRNDICVGDSKISGNAFYLGEKAGVHHGTILYDSDIDVMERALQVSGNKLSKHGIASVRSRVMNIKEIVPGITIAEIENAISEEFCKSYDFDSLERIDTVKDEDISDYLKKYTSDEWVYDRIRGESSDEL